MDAAELAQDSLADAYLGLSRCYGDVNDPFVYGRWLRGIARNKLLNWLRNRSGVHRRLEMAANRLSEAQRQSANDNSNPRQSDWLRIAASFAP